jgi:tetratricopeptide (TPR) repeat protein
MSRYSFRVRIFAFIGILFLAVSSVYAETAEEYSKRGVANEEQGNYAQAISDLNKAIEINPKYAEAYANRGDVYFSEGNFSQAISDYTKAIGIDPKNAKAYEGRGIVYFYQKDFDKAWEDVHKAESLGRRVWPRFIEDLKQASGREK